MKSNWKLAQMLPWAVYVLASAWRLLWVWQSKVRAIIAASRTAALRCNVLTTKYSWWWWMPFSSICGWSYCAKCCTFHGETVTSVCDRITILGKGFRSEEVTCCVISLRGVNDHNLVCWPRTESWLCWLRCRFCDSTNGTGQVFRSLIFYCTSRKRSILGNTGLDSCWNGWAGIKRCQRLRKCHRNLCSFLFVFCTSTANTEILTDASHLCPSSYVCFLNRDHTWLSFLRTWNLLTMEGRNWLDFTDSIVYIWK